MNFSHETHQESNQLFSFDFQSNVALSERSLLSSEDARTLFMNWMNGLRCLFPWEPNEKYFYTVFLLSWTLDSTTATRLSVCLLKKKSTVVSILCFCLFSLSFLSFSRLLQSLPFSIHLHNFCYLLFPSLMQYCVPHSSDYKKRSLLKSCVTSVTQECINCVTFHAFSLSMNDPLRKKRKADKCAIQFTYTSMMTEPSKNVVTCDGLSWRLNCSSRATCPFLSRTFPWREWQGLTTTFSSLFLSSSFVWWLVTITGQI
jgi:hypothetical protein